MKKERNHTFDVIKGIAILLILITHSKWTAEERLLYLFPFWVEMAVPFFMLISGYFGGVSLSKNCELRIYPKGFILNRLIRYTAPFIIFLIVEFIIESMKGQQITLLYIVKMIVQGGIGPGSYYYPVMVQFVFVIPLIYILVERYDFSGLIVCFILNGVFDFLQWGYAFSVDSYRLLIFRYIFLLGCGVFFFKHSEMRFSMIAGGIVTVSGGIFIIITQYSDVVIPLSIYWTGTSYLAVLFIIPFFNFIRKKNIMCTPVECLGKSSYHIFFVQAIYFRYFYETLLYNVGHRSIMLIVTFLSCISVGVLLDIIESKLSAMLAALCNSYSMTSVKKRCFNGAGIISVLEKFLFENTND
ncbi:hypothetical protein D7X98_14980 [bacterium 1XD8-76]|nr:hypothetical protein D7X98_14980 [bacterium 1XD8-76]